MEKNLNMTLVRGLQSFAHGAFYGKKGDMIEMPSVVANELAAAGLVVTVTEKTTAGNARKVSQALAPDDAGKPAPAPTAEPEDLSLKVAPVAHNKMAKPLPNKGK